MVNYLIITFLYRLLSGMIIMLISWKILESPHKDTGLIVLGVSLILSQIPAFFSNILSRILNKRENRFEILTSINFLFLSLIVFLIYIMEVSIYNLAIFNFILWIIFFSLESSIEAWFVDIKKNTINKKLNWSSITMTANQIGLMIGPVLLSIIWSYGTDVILLVITTGYMLISIWSYFIRSERKLKDVNDEKLTTGKLNIKRQLQSLIFISLILVWPTLTAINLVLPVYIQRILKTDISTLAYSEMYLAIGILTIGGLFSTSVFKKSLNAVHLLSICIFLGTFCIYFDYLYISMFLLGIGFGGGRIILREQIARKYTADETSKIVLNANAIGVIVSIVVVLVSIFNIYFMKYAPFLVCLLFLLVIFNIKNDSNQKPEVIINI